MKKIASLVIVPLVLWYLYRIVETKMAWRKMLKMTRQK